MNKPFLIGEAISWGWKRTWANIPVLSGLTLAIYVVNYIIQLLLKSAENNIFAAIVFSVVAALFGIYVAAVFTQMGLLEGKGVKSNWKGTLTVKSSVFGQLFLMSLVVFAAAVVVAFVVALLVVAFSQVPAVQILIFVLLFLAIIYVGVKLRFTTFAIVDGSAAIEGLKKSWKITNSVFWRLLGFFILLGLINLVGVIVLFIGLLVTIPLSVVASGFVYHKLVAAPSAPSTSSEVKA